MREIDYVLDFCVGLGKEMLVAGANLERVNIATELICSHYGLTELTIRVMNTEVAVSGKDSEGEYATRRINVPAAHIHLERLKQLNDLSRRVCAEVPDAKTLKGLLLQVSAYTYPKWLVLVGFVVAMASLCRIFGGVWQDVLVASLNTVVLFFLTTALQKANLNRIIANVTNMFVCTSLAFAFCYMGFAKNLYIIIITNAFYLIPGIPMVNAMRNIICGNEMNGILELLKVFLEVLTIAAGIWIGFLCFDKWYDSSLDEALTSMGGEVGNFELIAFSFTASLGFAVVFQMRPKLLLYAGLGGALTRILFLLLQTGLSSRVAFTALAAFGAALYAELLATAHKTPATVFLYPSIIPLIPGDLFYYAMIGIVVKDHASFSANALECATALLGISVGFVVCSSFTHYLRKVKLRRLFPAKKK